MVWLRVLRGDGQVDEEGLGKLEALETTAPVAIVTYGTGSWKIAEGYRGEIVNKQEEPGFWVSSEPLVKTKDVEIFAAESTLESDAVVALTLLVSSSLVVAADDQPSAIFGERLEALMRVVTLNPEEDDDNNGHDSVIEAMPKLVWAFTAKDGVSPPKMLEAALAEESGFSVETSKRNQTRLLVKTLFRHREAVNSATAVKPKACDLAAPKLAFGRPATPRTLGKMLRVWSAQLQESKAVLVDGWLAAVEDLFSLSLTRAVDLFHSKVPPQEEAMSHGELVKLLSEAATAADAALASSTRAVAPSPRTAAKKPPRPPFEGLRKEIAALANARIEANRQQALKLCESDVRQRHSTVLSAADESAGISSNGHVLEENGKEDGEAEVPPSRRAELWLQAYKGRLGSVSGDHREAMECVDAARDACGLVLATELPTCVISRCRAASGSLVTERKSQVDDMLKKRKTIKQVQVDLEGSRAKARDAMKLSHDALAKTMAETETAKMEKQAELATLEDEIEGAMRAADRVDTRLRTKLDNAVTRSAARLSDARLLTRRQEETASLVVSEARDARAKLDDAKLDALRVRCVTLGHEKANLAEHMELLEEHLERLKADLDQKHSEVAEVEHQWAQTKAKLPNLKAKHSDAERRRELLADLAKRLKLKCKDLGGRSGALPRQLLQHLDPMERQALDDL